MTRFLALALAACALIAAGCAPTDPAANSGALDHVTKDQATTPAEPPKSQPDTKVAPTEKDEPKQDEPKSQTKTEGTVVAYRDDKGQLLCPVMGSTIASEKDAIGYQDYKGVRYYFCCGDCPKLFKKDPEQWLKH